MAMASNSEDVEGVPVKRCKRPYVSFVVVQAVTLFFLGVTFSTPAAAQAPMKPEVALSPVPDKPAQPVAFSHKLHVALGQQCATCHTNPAPGNQMTVAATSVCMKCHSKTATGKPEVKKLAAFAKSKKPVPWVRVYKVLPGVVWSHKAHLDKGVKCAECHGDVGSLDVMAETTSVASKFGCYNCHTTRKVKTKTDCALCHGWFVSKDVASK